MATVEPRLYKGLQDYLPDQMAARQRIIDRVRAVCENHGYVPLGTPAMEYLDVLTGTGGEEATKQIFSVNTPEEELLGLRFDQTVPLARVVAQYATLPRPFRRYACSQVWRADKPEKGRFREFGQFDFDAVGIDGPAGELADVEIIALMCDAMRALEVGPFEVRYSSRAILGLLLKYAGVPDRLATKRVTRVATADGKEQFVTEDVWVEGTDVFRVLDKLEKVGLEKVRKELTTGYKPEPGDPIPGLGLSGEQVERIERFLAIKDKSRTVVLTKLRGLFEGLEGAAAEIDRVERISKRLYAIGYGDDCVTLDLSIARGLAYYTGPVFETVLLDAPQYGSVCSGGRYDDLVLRFHGERLPAVGASIGIDRLLAALTELGRIGLRKSIAQVLVTTMDESLLDEYLAMTFELRRAGVSTEIFLAKKGFGKQIKHADTQEIPLSIVCGSDEHARGVVTIKEMSAGKAISAQITDHAAWKQTRPGQTEVPRGEMVQAVKHLLGM